MNYLLPKKDVSIFSEYIDPTKIEVETSFHRPMRIQKITFIQKI
jgi:hypothetical protein